MQVHLRRHVELLDCHRRVTPAKNEQRVSPDDHAGTVPRIDWNRLGRHYPPLIGPEAVDLAVQALPKHVQFALIEFSRQPKPKQIYKQHSSVEIGEIMRFS